MNEIELNILARLDNAVNNHCMRTALARVRDLARIRSDNDNRPYQEHLYNLVCEYHLQTIFSKSHHK